MDRLVPEPPDGASVRGDAIVRARGRLTALVAGIEPRRRGRMLQWLTTLLVYVGSGVVLAFAVSQGWIGGRELLAWYVFVAVGLGAIYAAMRHGWSERFEDPALTVVQMVFGVLTVEWGYLIAGPVRSVTLFPLLLIFTFGAFSLSWRRITWLTIFAIGSLLITVFSLHLSRTGGDVLALDDVELRFDLTNVAMVMILLPALSLVAARLSSLRANLRSQRAVLTELLGKVQELATHDDLTGLANRRHMLDKLGEQVARFQRLAHPFSIAIIDLDHFKQINDDHGHAAGDEVLRAFADEATSTLRAGDLLSRWGGEEFLLLLPDTRGEQAQVTLTRLLQRVRAMPQRSGRPLSFSAGVIEYRPGETVAETVVRADREMYLAKHAGRNAVRLQSAGTVESESAVEDGG